MIFTGKHERWLKCVIQAMFPWDKEPQSTCHTRCVLYRAVPSAHILGLGLEPAAYECKVTVALEHTLAQGVKTMWAVSRGAAELCSPAQHPAHPCGHHRTRHLRLCSTSELCLGLGAAASSTA